MSSCRELNIITFQARWLLCLAAETFKTLYFVHKVRIPISYVCYSKQRPLLKSLNRLIFVMVADSVLCSVWIQLEYCLDYFHVLNTWRCRSYVFCSDHIGINPACAPLIWKSVIHHLWFRQVYKLSVSKWFSIGHLFWDRMIECAILAINYSNTNLLCLVYSCAFLFDSSLIFVL